MSDAEEDLRTAHSDVSGPDDEPSSPHPEEDLEMEIQRLFGDTLDAEMRENMSTDIVLDAIEAHIDTVIRAIGNSGDAATATDIAILDRFRAKKVAVEQATCEAVSMPPPAPVTPAIPFSKSLEREALVFFFSALVAPCALALALFGFTRSKLSVCGINCTCTFKESAAIAWSFFLILQIPRCFVFGFFTDSLGRETTTQSHQRSLIPTLRRPAAWVLGLLSLLFTVVIQMLVSLLDPQLYVLIPAAAIQVAVPVFIYCTVQKTIAAALPAAWMQLVPVMLHVVVPAYVNPPVALIMVFPILIGVIDRVLFYVLVAMMPEGSSAAIRTAAVFCQTFYPQVMTLVAPLALDLETQPALVALYAIELGAVEFLLSTHWIDRAVLATANRIPCIRGSDGAFVFGGHDMRLMSAYTRHASGIVGLVSLVPAIGLRALPIKVKRSECDGVMIGTHNWWGIWGAMCLAMALACGATALRRYMMGAVVQPLLFRCPFWAMWVIGYLVFVSPVAFGYLPE